MTERPDRAPDAPEPPHEDDAQTVDPDVSPLLTLEPSNTESIGGISVDSDDSNQPALLGPLLGTISPHSRATAAVRGVAIRLSW